MCFHYHKSKNNKLFLVFIFEMIIYYYLSLTSLIITRQSIIIVSFAVPQLCPVFRLIKGDGEVLEEIVSRDRHKQINRQATQADGAFFQAQTVYKH